MKDFTKNRTEKRFREDLEELVFYIFGAGISVKDALGEIPDETFAVAILDTPCVGFTEKEIEGIITGSPLLINYSHANIDSVNVADLQKACDLHIRASTSVEECNDNRVVVYFLAGNPTTIIEKYLSDESETK